MSRLSQVIDSIMAGREDRIARDILAEEFDKANRPEAAAAIRGRVDLSIGARVALAAIKRVAQHAVAFIGRPLSRELAYLALDSERAYQDAGRGNARRGDNEPMQSIGDHLVALRKLLRDTEAAWYRPDGRRDALDHIRKIGGVAVHCMEDHGAQPRE
jgi:hypothetical protein